MADPTPAKASAAKTEAPAEDNSNEYLVRASLIHVPNFPESAVLRGKRQEFTRFLRGEKVKLDSAIVDVERLLGLGAIKHVDDDETSDILRPKEIVVAGGMTSDPVESGQTQSA